MKLSRPSVHRMPFGAEVQPDGQVRFALWAPDHETVGLVLEGDAPRLMDRGAGGWHRLTTPRASAGSRYRYQLPDGRRLPDPASRFQPDDVHGDSLVIDPTSFHWTDAGWRGRPWAETVLSEIHIGAFTPEGTFQAAAAKLERLAAVGITAVEIMPLADFPGRRNWGYDGVFTYAPDASYGTPDDFRSLVDTAHRLGMSVVLDVVYNHFGPEGNYLPTFSSSFFTERHKTPWGPGINYDGAESETVRGFAIHNALYWAEEFHVDGLRLDAVHAIVDFSSTTLITELAERVRALDLGRPMHLLLENEDNEAQHLRRDEDGPVTFTAQWNDDAHHVMHVAATGEGSGYYADYLDDTAKLGRALAEGFAFQGEMMPYRGSPRGQPSADLPPDAFVAFLQNHDQIGNRAFGDRLTTLASPEANRALTAVLLLLPQIPLLFMGEEWGTTKPFPFFCDFDGELGEAVRKGRREEFKRFPEFQDEGARAAIPDPQAEATFQSAKLDWSEADRAPYRETLERTVRLLEARRSAVIPLLPELGARAGTWRPIGPGAVEVSWRTLSGTRLRLDTNLKSNSQDGFDHTEGPVLWTEGVTEGPTLGPWAVRWSLIGSRTAA